MSAAPPDRPLFRRRPREGAPCAVCGSRVVLAPCSVPECRAVVRVCFVCGNDEALRYVETAGRCPGCRVQ